MRLLRSILALLFALIIAWIFMIYAPVFGVRSIVMVVPLDATKNSAITHVVENSIVIGESAVRDTIETPRNVSIKRINASDAIALTTYGRANDSLFTKHKTLVDHFMSEVSIAYDVLTGIDFEPVGQPFTTFRYGLVGVILVFAVLFGTYLSTFAIVFIQWILTRRTTAAARTPQAVPPAGPAWDRVAHPFTPEAPTQHDVPPTHVVDNQSEKEFDVEKTFVPDLGAMRPVPDYVPLYEPDNIDEDINDFPYEAELAQRENSDVRDDGYPAQEKNSVELPHIAEGDFVNDDTLVETDRASHDENVEVISQKPQHVEHPSEYVKRPFTPPSAATGSVRGVPSNLPVVDLPEFESHYTNNLSDEEESLVDTEANLVLTKDHTEPTDDDLKRRLNQLLKGEL